MENLVIFPQRKSAYHINSNVLCDIKESTVIKLTPQFDVRPFIQNEKFSLKFTFETGNLNIITEPRISQTSCRRL